MGNKLNKICACENEKNVNFEQNLSNNKKNVIKIKNKELLILKSRNILNNNNNFNSSNISTSLENKNFFDSIHIKEIYYKNGDFYKGDILIKNNQKIKNGKGKYFFNISNNNNNFNKENKEYFYEGEFLNDKFHGKGILNLPNLKYEGNFANGFKNGKGILKDYKNNIIYKGEFLNDFIQGEGIEINNNNNTKYVGYFINNKKYGKGKLFFNINNNNNNEFYEGNFKNDKFNGKGIYKWSNNKFCIGNWKDNFLKGFGKFYEKDEIFFGYFNNNKKEGLGIKFYKENKLLILSHWKNDLIEGLAIFVNKKDIEYYEMKNNKKINKLNLIEINNNIEKLDEFRRLKEFYFCLEQNDELNQEICKDYVKLFNE